MPEISSKKKKFIKRNFRKLSLEELARQTGLTPQVIRPLIDEYSTKTPGKDQSAHIKKSAYIVSSWKTILLISLLFSAVAIIIYSPSLHSDFVFDDKHIIPDNSLIHITKVSQLADIMFSKEANRRIGLMSFALNYYFGGLNTFGYHLVNVIIHILNGLILFLLSYTILTLPLNEGRRKGEAFTISFLGTLLWLVHPIQTQAVSYIVQRLTSLSALFFLLSLFCYIKGRMHRTYKRGALFLLSLLLGLLALGTKQNAATLPLFIILSEFFFFQQKTFTLDRKKLGLIIVFAGLFFLIAGIYLGSDFISSMAQQYEMRGWTPLERVLTQLRVVILYASLLTYPHPSRLNLDHDFPVSHSLFSPFSTFLSLLVIIGLITLAIFLIKRNRLVSYSLFWFFGNLIIESSIIPLEMVFEHRLYLPSMALIIAASGLSVTLFTREWGKWVIALVIPFILLFSYWTYERALVWREPLSLWMDAVKKSPNKARPYSNVGSAYFKKGRVDEAIVKYEHALAIKPNFALVHYNLGRAYYQKGKIDKAISEYKQALSIIPRHAKTHNNLGTAHAAKGLFDEAISEHKKALVINPNLAGAHNNIGHAYMRKGMLDKAISEFKEELSIRPNFALAYYNLGRAYYQKGKLDKAISEYKKAIAINSNYAKAYFRLGVVYYYKRNYKLAIIHFDKAVELGHSVNPKLLELVKPYR